MRNLFRYELLDVIDNIIADENRFMCNKKGETTLLKLDGDNKGKIMVNYETRVCNHCISISFEEKETEKYIATINFYVENNIPRTLTFWGE